MKRLSLVKQLFVVFGILTLVFVLGVVPLLEKNVDRIVAKEMYQRLEMSQNTMIEHNFTHDDNGVHSVVFDLSSSTYTYRNLGDFRFSINDIYLLISKDLEKIHSDDDHSTIENYGTMGKDSYYYRIIALDSDDDYLVSYARSDYLKSLTDDIKTRVVYIQYGFLAFTALLILIWVYSLIQPLNKIKNYIESIRHREEATLNIDRKDEIGIVGDTLVLMRDELEKQEKVKEEMIHNISHDLKTPIALIKTYGQSVKDDIYPYGDRDSSMDVILENADRLENKVKDLLYLNRLDYLESSDVSGTPIEMKPLIEHIVSQMEALNHLTIEVDLDDVTFIGNQDHWRVAIENIIDNASRYAKSLIKITLHTNYLEIYNDGEPIDESTIDDLFKPYVKGVKGQFGLGLSIVYKTATLYHYSVNAINKDNGVSFVFTKE